MMRAGIEKVMEKEKAKIKKQDNPHIKEQILQHAAKNVIGLEKFKMPSGVYPRTKEMYLSRMGKTPWNKGLTKETDIRVKRYVESSTKTRRKLFKEGKLKINLNEKNGMWKGDKVKYHALHAWVKRHKPKSEFCERCKKRKPFDLANLSGKYKREVNDYKWLCRRCHMKIDKRLLRRNNKGQFKSRCGFAGEV